MSLHIGNLQHSGAESPSSTPVSTETDTNPPLLIASTVTDEALISAMDGQSGESQYSRGAVGLEAVLNDVFRGPLMAQVILKKPYQ